MTLLDRYIGNTVLQSTLVVMVVLMSLFAFVTFATELDKVGRGSYDAKLALQYTSLLLPRLVYQLFPIIVLLGSIIGLGLLAGQGELVVVRAAGVSLKRIIWTVMRVGLVLIVIMVLIGEFVAPEAEFKAQNIRAEAISGQISFRTDEGLWAKDGSNIIHIRDMLAKDRVRDISIYEFDAANQLRVVTKARAANFSGGQWTLEEVSRSNVAASGVQTTVTESLKWRSLLDPDLIGVVAIKPDYLSAPGLLRYIEYLNDNGLDSSQYRLALWKKAMMPVTAMVMIFLAVPFVFGPLRSVGVGQRIFFGILFGIGYFLVDQTVGHMGLVYGLPPLLAVIVAPLCFLMIAIYLVRRVR